MKTLESLLCAVALFAFTVPPAYAAESDDLVVVRLRNASGGPSGSFPIHQLKKLVGTDGAMVATGGISEYIAPDRDERVWESWALVKSSAVERIARNTKRIGVKTTRAKDGIELLVKANYKTNDPIPFATFHKDVFLSAQTLHKLGVRPGSHFSISSHAIENAAKALTMKTDANFIRSNKIGRLKVKLSSCDGRMQGRILTRPTVRQALGRFIGR